MPGEQDQTAQQGAAQTRCPDSAELHRTQPEEALPQRAPGASLPGHLHDQDLDSEHARQEVLPGEKEASGCYDQHGGQVDAVGR